MMKCRGNRLPLPSVDMPAVFAAPGKSCQGKYLISQRMLNSDSHLTRAIHFCHLPQKIEAMVGSSLEHVELPLVDHLVCKDVMKFLLCVGCPVGEPF